MVFRITQRVEHHHRVGHGGKIATQPCCPFSRSLTKATAFLIARCREALGNSGSAARRTASIASNNRNQRQVWCGALEPRRAVSGGSRNSSSILTPRGLRALGFNAWSTSRGTIVVRAQYEILDKWNGNQVGSSMISTGIAGTLLHPRIP